MLSNVISNFSLSFLHRLLERTTVCLFTTQDTLPSQLAATSLLPLPRHVCPWASPNLLQSLIYLLSPSLAPNTKTSLSLVHTLVILSLWLAPPLLSSLVARIFLPILSNTFLSFLIDPAVLLCTNLDEGEHSSSEPRPSQAEIKHVQAIFLCKGRAPLSTSRTQPRITVSTTGSWKHKNN